MNLHHFIQSFLIHVILDIYFNYKNTVFSNAACVDDGRFDRGLTSFGNILEL